MFCAFLCSSATDFSVFLRASTFSLSQHLASVSVYIWVFIPSPSLSVTAKHSTKVGDTSPFLCEFGTEVVKRIKLTFGVICESHTLCFCVCCESEVKVYNSNLMLCEEDNKVCVTKLKDCDLRPPSSVQNPLNMSCYHESFGSRKVVTCAWSQETDGHTESDVSLVFSRSQPIYSCNAVLTMSSILNITVRVKNYDMDTEIWSRLHEVFLSDIVRPSAPHLTVRGSTHNSVVVSWESGDYRSCRLRYRASDTESWSEPPDIDPPHMTNYTIKDLLPFNDYIAAVSCSEGSNIWSDWSSEVIAKTLERVPWKSPDVCYRVDDASESSGRLLLHLMWKTLDSGDAKGRVLGYQVSYRPVKEQQLQDEFILYVTEVSASLEVKGGEWNVTVRAFNMAGYGPAAQLTIDTQRRNYIPPVTNMWVSSSSKDLVVKWKIPPVPPVSHFNVQWHGEANASTSGWSTVDGSTASVPIQVAADDGKSYLISVVPVYKQQCGSARSLPASLKQGAQTLWPDQWQHTFFNLIPSTEYALHLLADNDTTIILPVRTDFDKVPVVATAIPLLLLAVAVFIVSILSRTVYKSHISSPQGSMIGQWLMDPKRQNSTDTNILDIKDFEEAEVLGVKGAISFRPNTRVPSEEDLHEGSSLLELIFKLSDIRVDTEYVLSSPLTTEHQPQPQTSLPQKEERSLLDCDASQQAEDALKCFIHQLFANTDRSCVDQMICEGDYVVNSYTRAESVSEQTDGCALICEADYIANSCFTAKTLREIGASEESTAL
ncbi:uncharacterized protein [Channa argus]|uniref:uncharacterized protein isoform X2 n=1 Tax=Channa argus TaxID=215402 RepID=UPI003520A3FE